MTPARTEVPRTPGARDRLPADAQAAALPEPRPPIGWQAPLLDLVAAVFRRWQVFLIVQSIGLGLGVASYVVKRPFFQSTCVAVLMPREKPVIDLEMTNGSLRTGKDIAARGDTGALMLPARVDTYTQLLRSDAVLVGVGERFASRLGLADDLQSVDLVHAIRDVMSVSGTEQGMITVEATAPDPALAADLANALVDEMAEASKQAERQLLVPQIDYLRGSLERARLDLVHRERALQEFAEQHGVVDLTKQSGDLLTMIRETEILRQSKVQQRLERLQAFTEEDHVARGLQQQIEQLDLDLARLRGEAFGAAEKDGLGLPELQLEQEALRGDVQRARDWIGTLESQIEMFSIRADQPTGAVTVLKRAIPVRQRAGPSKSSTIGSSLLVAFVIGVVLALLREQWERVERDPYLARRAEEIRAHVRVLAPRWLARQLDRRTRMRRPAASAEDAP